MVALKYESWWVVAIHRNDVELYDQIGDWDGLSEIEYDGHGLIHNGDVIITELRLKGVDLLNHLDAQDTDLRVALWSHFVHLKE